MINKKYCKDELPKGCSDCQKEDAFGDTCHTYQAYHQGRLDERRKIMEIVDSADDSENAMYLLGKYLIAEQLKNSNGDIKSPCCNCKSDKVSCCGCPEYFEWKTKQLKEKKNESSN